MGPGTTFHRLLWDDAEHKPDQKITLVRDEEIARVVLSSGKVYYDLYDAREAAGIDNVYLLRVEQLYPFPARALMHELGRFKQAEVIWCQEEPKNMGPGASFSRISNGCWIASRHSTACSLCGPGSLCFDGHGTAVEALARAECLSDRGADGRGRHLAVDRPKKYLMDLGSD